MPKYNDLNSLLCVMNDGPLSLSSDYYLFMLGTDTVYTPKPTKDSAIPSEQKSYENGETLSYMARLAANRLGENSPEIRADQPLAFSTPSVDVINGPTTLGSEVGERIAQGVFLVLKAIAEGKTTIQIAAHSRGAVESILIAHELERIKTAINQNPQQTIYQILVNSPCTYTSKAVKNLFTEVNESVDVRKKLSAQLSSAAINMFLMDPVPGGSWRGMGTLFAWRDERFYHKPPCTKAELILFRDERTRCFIPIKPTGLTPLIIPGHHGTASGNIYTQQFQPLPLEITERDTTLVQQLTLLKLLNFINTSTGLLDRASSPVDLEHSLLDVITNVFLTSNKSERSGRLLDLYKKIRLNDQAYRYFSETAYPYLGSEASSSGARIIHADGHNYTALDSIYASLGGQFINKEHAFLYLLKHMEFELDNDDRQPEDLITGLGNVLQKIFSGYVTALDQTADDMSSSISVSSQALLGTEADRKVTFEAISVFVDTISQKYLRNHLTVEAKTQLLAEVDRIFATLQQFKNQRDDAPINEIIDQCDTILRLSLKNTVQAHYQSLIDQSDRINKSLQYLVAPAEQFNEVFDVFIRNLESSPNDGGELAHIISDLTQVLREVSPVTPNNVKDALDEQFRKLAKIDQSAGKKAISLILKSISGKSPNLEGFFDTDTLDDTLLLSELDTLYDNIDSLINGFGHVQHLVGNQSLDINIDALKMHRGRVIQLAAEILVKKQVDLHSKTINISDKFFQIIKPQAIALGGQNPEVTDLFREMANLRQGLIENKGEFHRLTKAQDNLSQNIEEFKQLHQRLFRQLANSESGLTLLSQEYNRDKQQRAAEMEQLKQQQRDLTQQLADSKTELEGLTQQLAANKAENTVEVERLQQEQLQLTQQLAESKSALEQLSTEYAGNKQQRAAETKQFTQQQRDLTQQLAESRTALEGLTQQLADNKVENTVEVERLQQKQLELTQQLAESKVALEQLSTEYAENKQQRAAETEQFTQQQRDLTQQLADSRTALGGLTQQLAANKAENAVEVQQLQQAQLQLTQQLTESKSALEQLSTEYAENKQQRDLTQQLAESRTELGRLTQQLDANRDESAVEIAELQREQLKINQHLIDGKLTQEQLIQELKQNRVQFLDEMKMARKQQSSLTKRIEARYSERDLLLTERFKSQEQLIQQLTTPKEVSCANLIETKIVPLTKAYLIHLIEEASKLNPIINPEQSYEQLPDLTGDESDTLKYNMIMGKFTITKMLLDKLEEKETTPLPSDRITKFTQLLHEKNDQLKQHRDSVWMQFFKNCMVGIGIVCTGIIPGIVALLVYSDYAGKTSPLFFTRSKGDEFARKVEENISSSTISVN